MQKQRKDQLQQQKRKLLQSPHSLSEGNIHYDPSSSSISTSTFNKEEEENNNQSVFNRLYKESQLRDQRRIEKQRLFESSKENFTFSPKINSNSNSIWRKRLFKRQQQEQQQQQLQQQRNGTLEKDGGNSTDGGGGGGVVRNFQGERLVPLGKRKSGV